MFAWLGVASNWTSKPPACEGIATFCHAPELITQLAAVMVSAAEPAALPLTTPLLLTVAVAVLLLAHVTTRPVSVLPAASLGTAVNCWVAPTWIPAVVGLTVTDATGIVVIVTAAVSVSVPPPLTVATTRYGPAVC